MQFGSTTVVMTNRGNSVVWAVIWTLGVAILVWSAVAGSGGLAVILLGAALGLLMAFAVPLGSATLVRDGAVRNGLRRRWIRPSDPDAVMVDQPLAGQFRPVVVDDTGDSHPIGGPITAFAGPARRRLLAETHVESVRAALAGTDVS